MKYLNLVFFLMIAAVGGGLYYYSANIVEQADASEPGAPKKKSNLALLGEAVSASLEPKNLAQKKANWGQDPKKVARMTARGREGYKTGALGVGFQKYLVQNVLANYPLNGTQEIAAGSYAIPTAGNCRAEPPAPDEKIVNVHVSRGGARTAIWVASREKLITKAEYWLAGYRKNQNPGWGESGSYKFDLVLTDTSQPLYVILQSGRLPKIWNVHVAPGVTVSRIVVIGPHGTAVALPKALREQGITTALPFEEGCAVMPVRPIKKQWGLARSKNQEMIDKYLAEYEPYEAFFKDQFDLLPGFDIIGADTAYTLLAGPRPETAEDRVPYTPLQARQIGVIGEGVNVAYGTQSEMNKAATEWRRDIIASALGGDFSRARPGPIERPSEEVVQ